MRGAAASFTMDGVKTDTPLIDGEPSSATPPQHPAAPKKLYRSRENRVVKGVAGGVAEYFGVDPVLVRLGFLLLFTMGGLGFFAYAIAVLLVPKRPKNLPHPVTPTTAGFDGLRHRSLGVWVLVGVGVAVLADRLNLNIVGDRLWPLLLIGGGLIVLMRRRETPPQGLVSGGPSAAAGATSPSAYSGAAGRSSASATLIADPMPTRRDLHAEALAELHDPVVDEVERAVAELRAERLGASAVNEPKRATSSPVPTPVAHSRTSTRRRIRNFLIGVALLFTLVTTACVAFGLRVLSRGVGDRVVAVAPASSKFSHTFGAGTFVLDATGWKGLDPTVTYEPESSSSSSSLLGRGLGPSIPTGKVNMDFGELTLKLPTGVDRPTVRLVSHARIVSELNNGSGDATTFNGTRVTTIDGCPRGGVVDLDVSMIAGEIRLVPDTTPCRTVITSASGTR